VLVLLAVWMFLTLVFWRRAQFGLRTLVVFVTLCAVACCWLAVRLREARRQAEAVAEMEKKQYGGVAFDWELDENYARRFPAAPAEPESLRTIVGATFFDRVVTVWWFPGDTGMDLLPELPEIRVFLQYGEIPITDAGLKHLAELHRLDTLDLRHADVTDVGLSRLRKLTRLKWLTLNSRRLTGSGLAGLARLEELYLGAPQLMEAGLANLEGLTRLKRLVLDADKLTDAALPHLERLTNLQYLVLCTTNVTEDALKKLRRDLPNCEIEVSP
jgi:hypothetical protein